MLNKKMASALLMSIIRSKKCFKRAVQATAGAPLFDSITFPVHNLIWEKAKKIQAATNADIVPPTYLETEISSSCNGSEKELAKEAIELVNAFSTIPESEVSEAICEKLLEAFCVVGQKSKWIKKLHDLHSTTELSDFINQANSAVTSIKNVEDQIILNPLLDPRRFLSGSIKIPTGVRWLDHLSGGGHSLGETVGILGPSGGGKCIVMDEYQLSDEGFVKVGEPFDGSLGFKEHTVELEAGGYLVKTSHYYAESVKDTIKVTTELGTSIEGTPAHPLLILKDDCTFSFKKLEHIKEGDVVCVPVGAGRFGKTVADGASLYASNTAIPSDVMTGTRETQLEYVIKAFLSDGKLEETVKFSTTSEIQAKQLQLVLLNFGVVSKNNETIISGEPVCMLSIYGNYAYLFAETFFMHSAHLLKAGEKICLWELPYLKKELRRILGPNKGGYYQSDNKAFKMPFRMPVKAELTMSDAIDIYQTLKNAESNTCVKMCMTLLETFFTAPFAYAKIEKIEHRQKEVVVVDYTVPVAHCFYSSGFISHNTTTSVQILMEQAKRQKHVVLTTYEQEIKGDVAARLFCHLFDDRDMSFFRETPVDSWTPADWAIFNKRSALFGGYLHVIDYATKGKEGKGGAEDIRAVIRALTKQGKKPTYVLIDWLWPMLNRYLALNNKSITQESLLTAANLIIQELGAIAKEEQVIIVIFHQLSTETNRASPSRKPVITDAMNFRSFGFMLDVNYLIGNRDKATNVMWLLTDKNRHAGVKEIMGRLVGNRARIEEASGMIQDARGRFVSEDQLVSAEEDDDYTGRNNPFA